MGTLRIDQIIGTILYSVIGVVVFVSAYMVIEKISPFSVKKEISEDHNIALGIIIGSVIIGLSLIISAAIN
jgi:putative membrane protein